MPLRMSCPGAEQLQELLADGLSVDAHPELQAHLEACGDCQQSLEQLAAAGVSWERAARHLGESDEPAGPALAAAVEQLEATEIASGTPPSSSAVGETRTEVRPDTADEFAYLDPPTVPGHLGRLSHYEIIEVVGRGGMGVVFKALDGRLNRIVAVKVLSPHYASSASARRRFQREAKAAAAVSHDHVVPIYQVEETPTLSYLVMPLIVGKSLQERIDEAAPLDVAEILHIGVQIAQGLAAAHQQGLVHRDIKPANILLESGAGAPNASPNASPRVKITDFGLARAVDDITVTQAGVVTGTPMFMSPEQAKGEGAVDDRSDLFSLGSVLYMMCTGRPAFRANGTHAVIHRVIHATPPPIRAINPAIPEWLEAIVARLHAKRPEDRFPNAQEVADVLGRCLADLQTAGDVAPALPCPPTSPRWTRVAAAIAGIVTVAGGVVALSIYAIPLLLALVMPPQPLDDQRQDGGAQPVVIVPPDRPSAPGLADDWKPLFNGKNLDGWIMAPPSDGAWLVEKGDILTARSLQRSYLITEHADFADFQLRADVKVGDGARGGIFLRCSDKPDRYKWPLGYMVAIANRPTAQTGDILMTAPGQDPAPRARARAVKIAPDTWCKLEVTARGNQIIVHINGEKVAELTDENETHAKGRIALEIDAPPQGGAPAAVQFCNVAIKELRADAAWVPLFNGKDLANWTTHPARPGNWSVAEGGTLTCTGNEYSQLITQRGDFTDFHVSLEAKINARGKSGLFFRSREALKGPWPSGGYQALIFVGNANDPDWLGQPKTGSLLNLATFTGPLVEPIEWFRLEVIARGNHFQVFVKGQKTADYVDAKTQFSSGHLALEHSGRNTHVFFRAIKIKELPPGGA